MDVDRTRHSSNGEKVAEEECSRHTIRPFIDSGGA